MNIPAMIQAMKVSISEVLEQMFFLPIDMMEAQQENRASALKGRQAIAARIGFDGASSGTFLLDIPADLAESITADFLGTLPEELSRDQITGTVKEMINMLAGNSLSAYDPESSFNLHIPELASDIDNVDGYTGTIDIGIETLNSIMMLRMTTNNNTAPIKRDG